MSNVCRLRSRSWRCFALAALLLAGCSRAAKGPDAPSLGAADAGGKAIAQYDKSGDGKLDAKELEASPPLKVAQGRIDKNADGSLTAEEIADRIRYWQNSGTIIMDGSVEVTMDGKPLAGATVTFQPEAFLGPAYKICDGITDDRGRATIKGPDPQFPGIYLGFYRVKISKPDGGKETIPARYNTETELGWEQTDDLPDVHGLIQFDLTSG